MKKSQQKKESLSLRGDRYQCAESGLISPESRVGTEETKKIKWPKTRPKRFPGVATREPKKSGKCGSLKTLHASFASLTGRSSPGSRLPRFSVSQRQRGPRTTDCRLPSGDACCATVGGRVYRLVFPPSLFKHRVLCQTLNVCEPCQL